MIKDLYKAKVAVEAEAGAGLCLLTSLLTLLTYFTYLLYLLTLLTYFTYFTLLYWIEADTNPGLLSLKKKEMGPNG